MGNKRILAYIARRSGSLQLDAVTLVGDKLLLRYADGASAQLNCLAVTRALGLLRDLYAGTAVCVLLEFADGRLIEVPESCLGWLTLCEAIDRLPGARPFAEWYPHVQRPESGHALAIWVGSMAKATGSNC